MKYIIAGTYRILNKENNKVYNGSSVDYKRRLWSHKNNLRKDKNTPHLQNAWNKYGPETFSFEVREEIATLFVQDGRYLSKEDKEYLKEYFLPNLLWWEQKHLDEDESYKPEKGYNISRTAGSNLGHTFSKEHNDRTSASKKGRSVNAGKDNPFSDPDAFTPLHKQHLKEAQNRPEVKARKIASLLATLARKDKKSWNEGLTKDTSDKLKTIGEKISRTKFIINMKLQIENWT